MLMNGRREDRGLGTSNGHGDVVKGGGWVHIVAGTL